MKLFSTLLAFALVLTLGTGSTAKAQVSSFPYIYGFETGTQTVITGDGNWSSLASKGANDWEQHKPSDNRGNPGGAAELHSFTGSGNNSRLRVRLNTSGKTFSGVFELFEFDIYRNGAGTDKGNDLATLTIEYSTDGTAYTTIDGPRDLIEVMPAEQTWYHKSYTLPSGVGNHSTVYLSIKITSGGKDNFDRIQLDNAFIGGGALPVQVASYSASVVRDNDVEVSWRTVSEVNNYGFEVYRKRGDAGDWMKVGFTEGHGTTLTPQSYSYVDREVPFGKYYYRIKQIDLDGTSEIFPLMEVAVGVSSNKVVLAQNYPNPFNPSTVIDFVVPQSGFATMKIFNILGQEVATLFEGMAVAGNVYSARFDASNLPSGMYFYTLRSGGSVETRRMLLLK
jgi:hypothetical protein